MRRPKVVASTDSWLLVAVPSAVAGAASTGVASAAQARATKQVETARILDAGFFVRLVRQPLWLVGTAATVAGLVLQLVALAFAPLLVVQPVLITSLIFGGLFAARLERRAPDRVMVAGSVVCSAGIAGFLMVAHPSGDGGGMVPGGGVLPLAVALSALTAVALAVAVSVRPARALALAVATGVLYGLTAGLMKMVAGQAREGWAEPFAHWALYAACAVGPMGFLLSQNTFQQGRFLTPSLAVITALDPLVGVAIGVWWMGEAANTAPLALFGETVCGAVVVTGIALLSSRAAYLSEPSRPDRSPPGATGSGGRREESGGTR